MPLLPGTRTLIEIPVSDRLIADTIIRQKARLIRFCHEQLLSGECITVIHVGITLYAADGEGFGPALPASMQPVEPIPLSADNQTVVDAATGEILAIRAGEPEDKWLQKLESFAQPVMLQGDFFEYLRENAPVLIGDMIRQHIRNANQMGKFA